METRLATSNGSSFGARGAVVASRERRERTTRPVACGNRFGSSFAPVDGGGTLGTSERIETAGDANQPGNGAVRESLGNTVGTRAVRVWCAVSSNRELSEVTEKSTFASTGGSSFGARSARTRGRAWREPERSENRGCRTPTQARGAPDDGRHTTDQEESGGKTVRGQSMVAWYS